MPPIHPLLARPLARRDALALLAGAAAWTLGGCRAPGGRAEPDPDAFLALVRAGDLAGVERALEGDVRLARAADGDGRSAFVVAHLHGHVDVAEALRATGLELDVVEATLAADWERVEALAAADPDAMNRAHAIGGGPLHASALAGGSEQYRLRALGCDSNGRPAGGSGFTPGRSAMDCRDPLGAWLAATDILSNGGDVNAPQRGGDSVLHGAVRVRDARLVRLALRKGGDAAATDDAGRTPLDLARELGWAEGAALLARPAAVPVDWRASRLAFRADRTPFQLDPLEDVDAALQSEVTGRSHFDVELIATRLAEDPRLVHSVSTDDELAIEACGHTGQRAIIRLHLDRGAPLSLPTALSLGDLDHARWLLEGDPRHVFERGPHDFPVTWYPAIGGDSVEGLALLLEFGADLEAQSGGETALHQAARRDRVDLVRFLAERGARLDAVAWREDRAGLTPLDVARAGGREAAADALVELGATA